MLFPELESERKRSLLRAERQRKTDGTFNDEVRELCAREKCEREAEQMERLSVWRFVGKTP